MVEWFSSTHLRAKIEFCQFSLSRDSDEKSYILMRKRMGDFFISKKYAYGY